LELIEGEEMGNGAWSPAEDEQLQKLAWSGFSLMSGSGSAMAAGCLLNRLIVIAPSPRRRSHSAA
jgi:hypothetical protein